MAIVKKANRIITVEDNRVESYLKRGYNQVDENGKVIKRATGGGTVSIEAYNKLLDQLEEAMSGNERVEELQAQVDELEKKAKEFAERGKALQEENNKLKSQLGNRKG